MSPIMSRCLVAGMVILATACSSGTAAHSPPVASVPAGAASSPQPAVPTPMPTQAQPPQIGRRHPPAVGAQPIRAAEIE